MNTKKYNVGSFLSSPQSLISFMEHSDDHWFMKDKDSKYIYMNKSALRFFGYPKGFSVEGRLDKDMPLSSSQELWPKLVEHDQKTLKYKKKSPPLKLTTMEKVI